MQIQEQQQQPSPGLRKYIKYCNKLNKNCPGVNYNFIYEDDVQQLFKIKNFKFLILRARISYIVCKITPGLDKIAAVDNLRLNCPGGQTKIPFPIS